MRKKKRKKINSKKEAQRHHFEMRTLQRVGQVLNQKELIWKIQNGELEFIERQSNRVSLFRYVINGTAYKIVYDRQRKQVVTILYEVEQCKN